jgi:dienelactone hydrolase
MRYFFLIAYLLLNLAVFRVHAQAGSYPSPNEVSREFRQLLERPQTQPRPKFRTINTDSVSIERGYFYSEATEKVPVLIYTPLLKNKNLPVVICLHGTGGSKDDPDMKELLYQFAKLGFMAVAIDARFHGERIPVSGTYVDAITMAWRNKNATQQTHPFFYDTVYDLWRLTDYLVSRKDVDASRIGMMGISMGGIETWMAAAVDKRIKVAVPVIAAQSFRWSLENDRWQGRVGTIRAAHQAAATDLGDAALKRENVEALWNKLLPGILDKFDCPSMVRLFAPRPLLLLNNGADQNCPLPGAEIAFESARKAYVEIGASDKLKVHVSPDQPHRFLPEHLELTLDWFHKWL